MKTMKRLVLLLASVSIAGQAGAKTLDWHGTLHLDLWRQVEATFRGSGVATVNDSSGGAHLSTLRLAGGISGSAYAPVTDPLVTGSFKSIYVSPRLGTGTIRGISGAPPLDPPAAIPIAGVARLCLFATHCEENFPPPIGLTSNEGNTGIGVGGLLTIGGNGAIRISVESAPWTLGIATGINQTQEGGFVTLSRAGFVHGAASASDSSTATGSGVIQLIAPQQVTTSGIEGNNTAGALFSALTLHFIPEPGLLLLIGSGVVGLGLLGRSRMKR